MGLYYSFLQHIFTNVIRLEAPSAETIGLLRCQRLLEVASKLEAASGVVKLGEDGQWEAGEVLKEGGADGDDDLMMLVERLEAELLEDIDSSEEEPEWEASPQVQILFPFARACTISSNPDSSYDRRSNRRRAF